MALRFKSEFRNLAKDLYKIEIHDSSFSGTETEFVLRNQGFKLSYTGGENTWDLIKPSTLSFTINVDNNTLKTFISDLTSSDETRFTVKVFLDNTRSSQQTPPYTPDGSYYKLYWLGYIEKRLITIDDSSYPYDLNLVCLDGIERLKTLDYKASATSPYEDLVTINTHISRILGKIDVGNHFAATDDMFATRINWYATNSIHSTAAGVFANTKLHSSAFNTFNEQNEVVFKSFYDVLNIICRLFQCRFMLNKGRFYFTHFLKLDSTSDITYNSYRKNGDVSTTANISIQKNSINGEYEFTGISNPNVIYRRPGFFQRTKTFGGKLKSVKIKFNGSGDPGETDDFTGDLYPLNYFPAWEYENSNWIPYGQSLEGPNLLGFFQATQQITFRIHYNFSIRVTRTDATANTPYANNSFLGRVVIPFWLKAPVVSGSSANNAFWETETITATNSTDPIPSPWLGASWVTSNQNTSLNNAQVFKTPVIQILANVDTQDSDSSQEYLFDTMVQTGDCPVTEASGVHLYNDYEGDWGSAYTNNNLSGSDNNWFAVESLDGNTIYRADQFSGYHVELVYQNIELYAYQDGEPFAGSVIDSYVDSNEQNDTNSEQLVIDNITFNDGPNAIPEKVIWVNNGSDYIQSTTWKLDGAGNPFKIHKLITDLILKYNYLPREVLNSTILVPFSINKFEINPTTSFWRWFRDENGDLIQNEVYSFNRLEYDANLNQYSFSGTKTAPITAPTIVTEDNPTNPDPGGGYEGDGFVDNGGNDTVIDLIINDAIGNINEFILPDATVKTSIDVTGSDGTGGIDIDIADNTEILIMASNPTRRIKKLKINGNVNKGDTSITVDGFTPEYVYESGAKIIVSRVSLMGSSGGGGGGTMSSWKLQADSGTDQTITDGDEVKLIGVSPISTLTAATDDVKISHDTSGASAGSYTNANVTVDTFGHITAVSSGSSGTMSSWKLQADSGTDQTITDGDEVKLIGVSPISTLTAATDDVKISHDTSGASAGSYTNANVTVDTFGHITAVSSGSSGTPGGQDTQVQFNDNGSFAGTDLLKVTGTNELTIGGTNTNTKLNAGADIILGADVAGGTSSTIQYLDSGSTNRVMLGAYATNIVVLSNRAANGEVQIRANTSTAGASGELTIATFKDTSVDFLNAAELRGTNIGNIFDTEAYLTALDFCVSNSTSLPTYTKSTVNGGSAQINSSSDSMYATFQVPLGYQATHVQVNGNTSHSTFDVYGCSWATDVDTALTSSPSVNSNQALSSSQTGLAGRYLSIKFTPGSSANRVYGAKITLARV